VLKTRSLRSDNLEFVKNLTKLFLYPCKFRVAALQQYYFATHHRDLYSPSDSGCLPEKGRKTMLLSIVRLLNAWKRYGVAMQELSHLSDRELADIGITRGDIQRIAWEQARA
jgi:uncharacterized protein YjiS (DUF1127 family)